MVSVRQEAGGAGPLPPPVGALPLKARASVGELPPAVASALWRGAEMSVQRQAVVVSGFAELDRELPGGGWPCQSLTEVLCAQPAVLEWRLIGPALRQALVSGGSVVVVGPPQHPHLPGLRHVGLQAQHLVWVQAEAPAQRLWCTEQLIKGGGCAAVLAWLPRVRPEQIRRLQVLAQGCEGPVFLFRPAAAQHEASAAPLRVLASVGPDWELRVQVFKRRGPAHDGVLRLASVPGGLASVLTPRLRQPSRLLPGVSGWGSVGSSGARHDGARQGVVSSEVSANAVGSAAASSRPRRHAALR